MLIDEEKQELQEARDYLYNNLPDEIKKQVDSGVYSKVWIDAVTPCPTYKP
jgi:hypothetical protein